MSMSTTFVDGLNQGSSVSADGQQVKSPSNGSKTEVTRADFRRVLETYNHSMTVLKPFKADGALRIEVSERMEPKDWSIFVKGVYASKWNGKYTYYVSSQRKAFGTVPEIVHMLKEVGLKIPRCNYKGKQ